MWPPEIDIIEAFISSSDYPRDGVATNLHWVSGKGTNPRACRSS
jgi:hypothetical protein